MAFKDTGMCNMRDRIAMRKEKVADVANKQLSTIQEEGTEEDDEF